MGSPRAQPAQEDGLSKMWVVGSEMCCPECVDTEDPLLEALGSAKIVGNLVTCCEAGQPICLCHVSILVLCSYLSSS